MNFAWYDLVGSAVVGVVVLTYLLLQSGRLQSESLAYSLLNGAGAGLIVFSLVYDFNFSAFVVELLWVLISLYGVARYFLKRR